MSSHLEGNPFGDMPDNMFPPVSAAKRLRGETEVEEPCGDETAPKRKAPRVAAGEGKSPEAEEEKSPEAGEGKSPEAEGGKSPEAGEGKSPEAEEGKSPEAEEEKSPEAGEGKSPEDEEGKSPEAEEGKSPEAGEGKSPENEEGKSPEDEEGKSPEAGEGKSPEDEEGKSPEAEEGKSPEAGEGKSPEAEQGKSLEDEEGKSPEEEENTCFSLRSRAARLEAKERCSVQQHRFHLEIAAQENESLRSCIQDLRRSLIALQQQRRTGAAGNSGNNGGKSADPMTLARLLVTHENTVAQKQWETHIAELRSFSTAPDEQMETEEMNTEKELQDEEKMLTEGRRSAEDKRLTNTLDAALAPLLPALDSNTGALARTLAREVRVAGAQRDAMLAWSTRACARARALEARVRRASATSSAAELSLLVALRQCATHTAAHSAARRHAESESRRSAARRRVERAELSLAALFAAGAGGALSPPTAPPAAAVPNGELEKLCARLSREVVYLRRAVPATLRMSACASASACAPAPGSLRRGRDALLRHCCAGLAARLAELTRRVALALLSGTATAPPTAAQDARLRERRAHVDSQRAAIRAFLRENARLQPRHAEGDVQAPLVAAFNAALSHLRASVQAHTCASAAAGSSLRAVAAALALRLRLSHAADRVRLAEAAVAVEPHAADAVAAALARFDGGARLGDGPPLSALRPIAVRRGAATPQKQKETRAVAAAEREAARAALAAREEVLEWCRQQCPRECAAALPDVNAEIARLRAAIDAAPARDAEAERRLAAQLREKAVRCREQCAVVEQQWRCAVEAAALRCSSGNTENEESKGTENGSGEGQSARAISSEGGERLEEAEEENENEEEGQHDVFVGDL